MENGITIFKNEQFGEVRTAGTAENPLFCANDICRALGYANGRDAVAKHCDEGDVAKCDTPTESGTQTMTYVNESGLYSLIFGSKLASAKQFKKWVTSEVLPSIRKHGAYMTDATIEKVMNDPDSWIKLLQNLKEERQQRQLAESKVQLLEEVTKEQAPKVVFADAIVGSQSSCLIGELAKIISQNGHKIGQNRLFDWMRKNHYLGTTGEYYNIPNQKYIEQGLFELKKSTHSENGVMKTTVTPKVLPKGQLYFINMFLKRDNSLYANKEFLHADVVDMCH